MTGEPEPAADAEEARRAERIEAGRVAFAGEVSFVQGVADLSQLPEADRSEVAFAGRSNAGKSSLINALTGRHKLARSSQEPGRTREINYFAMQAGPLYLVDLPGYGYAKVSRAMAERWQAVMRDYLRGRATLARVFLLVDARRGVLAPDREMMEMLDVSAVPYQIVLTKTDKLKASQLDRVCSEVGGQLKSHPAALPELIATSAEKGAGLAELRAQAWSLASERGPAAG